MGNELHDLGGLASLETFMYFLEPHAVGCSRKVGCITHYYPSAAFSAGTGTNHVLVGVV